ncbi:carboxylating nicotinate-nucleotide diphosphorylase [Halococcoides cellulosivorans]|uniref:Nicotinate-nucleotide pyrophosphorylase [carboxylating] n=1 Tax=Halococcoides cellulosivorans TaxID=1679096 RepID=A0A2R4WYE2_9EURY|nr:carboxylating nicotinate-nucleotide diphosphorylase [Halococcoides cellulosivorans]AWB26554.1 carboxylating nicotinate-nucleotide diphosphorylase [Halococcoides cellulosivorans]
MLTDAQIDRWLDEDLGHHDVTNDLPGTATGRLVATEAGTVAGVDAARRVFERLDCAVDTHVDAGDRVDAGATLCEASGPTRAVLRAERVAVNLAGHASGIATATAAICRAVEAVDPSVTVAGTRKTTPGLRGIEKRAIAAGGGDTHRLGSSHAVMIKDNHVAAFGLEDAIERFRERASFTTPIEVEVETVADAERAAALGVDIVLLDNMDPATVERAVERIGGDGAPIVEASGAITRETAPDYAATGVDVCSVGALTHSAPALDLSFRLA